MMPTFSKTSPNPRCEQKTTSLPLLVEANSMNCFSASDTVTFSMGAIICLFKQFITEILNDIELNWMLWLTTTFYLCEFDEAGQAARRSAVMCESLEFKHKINGISGNNDARLFFRNWTLVSKLWIGFPRRTNSKWAQWFVCSNHLWCN